MRLFYQTLVVSSLLCITVNAFAIQQSTTAIQTGNKSPYVIQNDSPSQNGNLMHASLLFYKAENGVSCTCGRYDSIAMPSDTMISWSGQVLFKSTDKTKLIQVVQPVFPAGAQCMQVALYGNEEAAGSKKNAGWFLVNGKDWACFNKGVKKTVHVIFYNPATPKTK